MDVDLSELDDWLGTLEELQLGLELCHSVTGTRQNDPNVSPTTPGTGIMSGSASCVNRTFSQQPASPRFPVSSSRAPTAHVNPVAQESASSYENTTFPVPGPYPAHNGQSRLNGAGANGTHAGLASKSVPVGTIGRTHKEATAESDLSSLLQELEVVEERMKELESENTTFTRRYSLASSPQATRLTDQVFDSTDFTSTTAGIQANLNPCCSRPHLTVSSSATSATITTAITSAKKPTTNGFVSAQWAAQLNPELGIPERGSSSQPPPPPPAFLGAGDACVSPPVSPQPPTPSIALLEQTEAGIWSMNPQNMAPGDPMLPYRQTTPKSILNKPNNIMTKATQCVDFVSTAGDGGLSPGSSISTKPMASCEDTKFTCSFQPSCTSRASPLQTVSGAHTRIHVVDMAHTNDNHSRTIGLADSSSQAQSTPLNQSSTAIPLSSGTIADSPRQPVSPVDMHYASTGALNASGLPSSHLHRQLLDIRPNDGDDESSLSGLGSWSPGQPVPRRDLVKTNSLVGHGGSDGLSNSLSPESSLSDKSFSESTELGHRSVAQSNSNIAENQMKKLVVRIFRPDRTTKAILIEENMTAGEVASMMIEKNFLQPSTRLAVVEKVPALKIERVFEEHEKVADCILSWPTRSQNMIFFEEREDHFGLIESPSVWLGEEFVNKYRYASAEAMQMMLNNIEQAGFPEWRDYLYIRKPGEKTWSRRLCVLRSSGLYTSKKNRKILNPTDLIRILVLDSHLQLYTTTGGWTRMRAPTPHGFAFKPYSAQDPASTHVFCFCATDEKALRNWVSRLRIAKYGRQLFLDYQSACTRVQRQVALRHGSVGMNFGLNGSLSAGIYRKSSLDILNTSSNPNLTTAESTKSLVVTTSSPCVHKRYIGHQQQEFCSENRGTREEGISYNQLRTLSMQYQTSKGFERATCSPSGTTSPHAHVGLCPQAPHQVHIFNRGAVQPSGIPKQQISRYPGNTAQPDALRRA